MPQTYSQLFCEYFFYMERVQRNLTQESYTLDQMTIDKSNVSNVSRFSYKIQISFISALTRDA